MRASSGTRGRQGRHLGERIGVRTLAIGRGLRSGVETSNTNGFVYTMSPRGLIARVEVYWKWEEAAAALGTTRL